MNDTPLTAKAKIACGFQAVPQSFLEHAEKLERENAALREALQNCAISASGQNWQQIAWIVEGALHRGKEAQP